MKESEKIKILFIAENITTSQVVRLVLLAKSLNSSHYEIHFACSSFPDLIFSGTGFQQWTIFTLDKEQALKNIEQGKKIYTEKILDSYIKEELNLFHQINPAIVIGDFRLSLCISTAVARIPFINLINAYWHPNIKHTNFPIPDHPIVRWLGFRISSMFYPLARPFVFYSFARPVNKLRRKYGLTEIGNLKEVLTYGDRVIFPDVQEMIPLNPPSHQQFIGPLIWSPNLDQTFPEMGNRPLIYVTPGSSGTEKIISTVVQALKSAEYFAIISLAGMNNSYSDSDHLLFRDYVDGSIIMEKASMVICNGGSSTAYQALAYGKPILGIPSNLDQHLSMKFIVDSGAGILLRSDKLTSNKLNKAIKTLLNEPSYRNCSEQLKNVFMSYSPHTTFEKILSDEIFIAGANIPKWG